MARPRPNVARSVCRAAAALTTAMLSSIVVSGCASSAASACTDAAVYLIDNTTATTIATGSHHPWDERHGVVLSAQPVPTQIGDSSWSVFAPVSGASSFVTFLADPGSERTPAAWRLWGDPASIDDGVTLPAAWPGYFSHGSQAPVKAAGGTYSMGVAYLDQASLESAKVVKAYLTTIQVTAGTGEWTFSDAPRCQAG